MSYYNMYAVFDNRNYSRELGFSPVGVDFLEGGFPSILTDHYTSLYDGKIRGFLEENMGRNERRVTIGIGEGYSCREVVLSCIRETCIFSKVVASPNNYGNRFVLFVEITHEYNNNPLTADSIYGQKILKFAEKVLGRPQLLGMGIVELQNRIFLSATVSESNVEKTCYMVSLLLWVIRNSQILDKILADIGESTGMSLTHFYGKLSVEFLLNSNWGDGDNSNLYLSIASYMLQSGLSFPRGQNGAHNAGANVRFSTFIHYLRDVFVKVFPDRKSVPQFHGMSETQLLELHQALDFVYRLQEKG